jgi:TolA-binding protein
MRFLTLIAIVFLGFPLWAADPGDRLAVAEAAFRNRLVKLADSEFNAVLENSTDPVLRFQAYLGLARIYVSRGRRMDAGRLLAEMPEAPNSELLSEKLLIQIDVALLNEDITNAGEWLATLPILSGNLDIQRKRLEARYLEMQGKSSEAIALLTSGEAMDNLAPVLQLDLAEMLWETGQNSRAIAMWESLAAGIVHDPITQQARLQLAKVTLLQGDAAKTRDLLETLIKTEGLHEELEAEIYPVYIRLLESEKAYLEAAAYLKAFEKLIQDSKTKVSLQAMRAQNLIRGGELVAANELLQRMIAESGDHPDLATVQLLLARTFQQSGDLNAAVSAYISFLSVFTDPQGLLEAQTGLAAAHEELKAFAKAELLYGKIYQEAPADSELKPMMLLKFADMALALKKNAEALNRYEQFLKEYPDHENLPAVLIQMSQVKADQGDLNGGLNILSRIRLRYPDTVYAEKALIQQAILQQQGLRPEQALGSYDRYLELYPDGVYVADAMIDKGITAYRLGLFDLALRQFKEIGQRYPSHSRVEQAQSLIGWTYYLMGDDEAARRTGREFLKKYPQSVYANEVRFWLAEVAFNHGEYSESAAEFQKLIQPDTPIALQAKAHYLAGRSLLADKKPEAALKEFSAAREVGPEGPFAADGLFYMGDVMTELGRFDEAILVFDQLIRNAPDSYLIYAARGRMGDCQYTLGEKDPSRYLEALNSYKLVEESKDASLELRLQAMYKVGRTLNALGRKEEARRQLEKMIQMYMENKTRVGSDAATWFLRAVADVAQSYEQAGEYRDAINIYEKLRNSGLPQASEGARRVEDLRREHRILF